MLTHQGATSASGLLLTAFGSLTALGDRERQTLRALGARASQAWRQNTVLPERQPDGSQTYFIVSGWACRARVLNDGRRQIIHVFLPGDAVGLSGLPRSSSATNVIALSPLRTVRAHECRSEWTDRSREPVLSAALDLMAAEDELFMVNHIVRLGRQNAYERMASWLMELDYRLSARGLSNDGSFLFPLTQETIADVVGLSVVHVNRTLQEMRRDNHIELKSGRLRILDRSALIKAGEFVAPSTRMALAQPGAVSDTNTPDTSSQAGATA